MVICYSGKSAPTAFKLADESSRIRLRRGSEGDINWGRSVANTALNPDTTTVTNKRLMRELFADNGVPMPKLLSLADARRYVGEGRTIIGRPDTHTQGRGFWKINTLEGLHKAIRGTRKKKGVTHFMEYVIAPREYRVHIFLGKSIRISEKEFGRKGETAHGAYVTIKPSHNVKHVRKAAKQAVAAVGLDFGAVDILATDDRCWVLEVNSAPALGGSMPQLYARKFLEWYEQLH